MKKHITLSLIILLISMSSISFAQWTAVNNGLTNLNATSVVMTLDTLFVGTVGGGVFKSIDFGETWVSVNGDLGNLNVNNLLGVGLNLAGTDNGVYLRSHFSTNWYHYPNTGLANTHVNSVTLTEANEDSRITVCTPGGVFRLNADDVSWSVHNNGLTGDALDVRYISGYEDDSVNYSIAATKNGVYMTLDGLASWQPRNNGLTGTALQVNQVSALGTAGFACTDNGLFFSSDLGSDWEPTIENERIMVTGLTFYPFPSIIFFAFGDNGFYTRDFVWHPIDMTGVTGGYVTSTVSSSEYVFITTQTGGVFRSPISVATSIQEITTEVPSDFVLSQNYPNPFNPTTMIRFAVPSSGLVVLKVYDLLGKEVAELVNEVKSAGTYEVNFDASKLSSGVYYYKLTSGSVIQTRKMILVK